MIDITPLINAIITLCSVLIATFLIPWLKKRAAAEDRDELMYWLTIAVTAAEEFYKGSGFGEQKSQYVRNFLAERGYSLNESELFDLVHSTVWQTINKYKGERNSSEQALKGGSN